MPQPKRWRSWSRTVLQDLLELTPKKDVLFIIGDWNAKVGSQETPGKESESEVAQLCPTPSDPMDCSPPGSSIHGIFQATVLEWVAISFSRGSSRPRDPTLQAVALTSEPPGKPRNTWSNRQIWPWNTEWSRAKTNRVLPRKCTGHNKHPLPTTQEKTLYMDITRWSTLKSGWLYSL